MFIFIKNRNTMKTHFVKKYFALVIGILMIFPVSSIAQCGTLEFKNDRQKLEYGQSLLDSITQTSEYILYGTHKGILAYFVGKDNLVYVIEKIKVYTVFRGEDSLVNKNIYIVRRDSQVGYNQYAKSNSQKLYWKQNYQGDTNGVFIDQGFYMLKKNSIGFKIDELIRDTTVYDWYPYILSNNTDALKEIDTATSIVCMPIVENVWGITRNNGPDFENSWRGHCGVRFKYDSDVWDYLEKFKDIHFSETILRAQELNYREKGMKIKEQKQRRKP